MSSTTRIGGFLALASACFLWGVLHADRVEIDRPISVVHVKGVPADDWFERQRAFPFDEIPASAYLKSIEHAQREMRANKPVSAPVWVLAGPTNIEGRITAIAVDPTNPMIVYAGCANGGVWKSVDFCKSWVSLFDHQNTTSIGALAIDPFTPSTLYCGTGEANSLRSYYPGTGLYKSTDAGKTWQLIGLPNSFSIGNIAINPQDPREIYVAAVGSLRHRSPQRGVYKTTDAGTTWVQSLFVADSVGAIDVAVDPQNPDRVLAAMWERMRREDDIKYGGAKSALYLSTNRGMSWSVVTGGFPSNQAELGRISIEIAHSNPSIIYALTALSNGLTGGLYRSSDGGSTWSAVNPSVGSSSNYAWFNRICRVDPSDPNHLFCGGISMYASTNGGSSFISGMAYHVDQHAVAFAPSNVRYIVIGNDGGIDFSTDGGLTWWQSQSLPITQFYAGEINPSNPYELLGGTQDNGTIRTLDGGLDTWTDIYGGDGFYCRVDYTNPMRVYASSQYGGLGYSMNGGLNFYDGTAGLDLTYTNWMTPYVLDKNNPMVIYCGTSRMYRSTDGMASWAAISPDLSTPHVQLLGTITTIDVSKSDPSVIYCGTDNAKVWVTTNGGTDWRRVDAGLPYRWVTRVTVHPESANICYVTLSGYKIDSTGSHIYRTTDYGTTWTSLRGNLSDAPINDVVIDPENSSSLYIATDIGVMATTDLGASWSMFGAEFPTFVPCHDLTFDESTRTLVAWTHGRSAWWIGVPSPLGVGPSTTVVPERFRLEPNYPNPFNASTDLRFRVQETGWVTLKVFDVTGREVATVFNGVEEPGTYTLRWDASGNASGVYVARLTTGRSFAARKMLLLR